MSQERKGLWFWLIWEIEVLLWGRRQSSAVSQKARWVRGGGDSTAGHRCAASTAAPRSPWTDACLPSTLSAVSAGVWLVHWTAACRGRQDEVHTGQLFVKCKLNSQIINNRGQPSMCDPTQYTPVLQQIDFGLIELEILFTSK